jgi:protein required for attachment to host cells
MTQNDPSFDPAAFWLLITDARRSRLFQGKRTPAGRLHLDERARLDEVWAEQEHHRPAPLGAPSGRSYIDAGHADEERMHRFAKTVAGWMDEQARAHKFGKLHLFAPKRFLGVLRPAYSGGLKNLIVDEAHDLAQLSAGELADHPAVMAIPPADERKILDDHLRKRD